jgi:hypothetical protein
MQYDFHHLRRFQEKVEQELIQVRKLELREANERFRRIKIGLEA